ncbi:MAG: hypothetical protein HGA65_11865, partial [Oscillochloris sp.]|nr:hypothetical protein [Oscillochloris sp.]
PLFVEELTKALREGAMQLPIRAIPTTLHDSLLVRMERVGPARETLGWAAALGREFTYAILSAVVPYGESRLQSDLAVLIEAELIVPRYTGRDTGYAFKHALVQEAAHATLLRRTRQTYHRRIAEGYATCFPQIAEAQPELLAQHYAEAGVTTEATDHWLRAGGRAIAQGATQEARVFFAHAMQLIGTNDHARRWQALIGQEQVFSTCGERAAQQVALGELRNLAEALDDDARRAYVYLRQTRFAGSSGDYQGVLALVDRASGLARRVGNLELELEALAYKAQTLAAFHDLEATRPVIEMALTHLDGLHNDLLRARILTAAAYYYLEADDFVRAVQFQRQGLEAAQRAADYQLMLKISANLGLLYTMIGCYPEARATLERAQEQAMYVGDPWMQAGTMRHMALVDWGCGDLVRAQALFEQALALLTEVGDAFGAATCHGYLGYMLAASGNPVQAAQHLAQARTAFATIGLEADRIEAQAAYARVILTLGQCDTARGLAVEVWEFLRAQGVGGLTEPSLVCLCVGAVFAALGDPDLPSAEPIALGYHNLIQRAAKISDPEWRQSFLEKVPLNRALVERWQEIRVASPPFR